MAAPVRKYNPGFLTDDELVASFCVRTAEFEMLVETLLRECTGASNPHQIVIGPRGSGKTSLLLRVAAEARRDDALAALCFPVVFAEESYEVAAAGEFWLECLTQLAVQAAPYGEDEPDLDRTVGELRAVRDDRVLGDRCLGALLDFADRRGQRLLLVVENLNMLFRDIADPDAGWELRHVLQTEPRIILFASATSRFDEIDHPDHALYDLFRVRTLRPLDTDQCAALWEAVAGRPAARETVRSLEILTGGSPRLIAIVARFGAGRSFRELMADLLDLVDDHTEYFKSHLESLPAQERRVYLALAALWKPATTREIADRARLAPSSCSAQLARLGARGAVQEAGGSARRKQYYLTERLYNVYYLLRRRSGPDRLVEALVRFMESYYSPPELKDIGARMASELAGLEAEMLPLHRAALARLMELPALAGDRADLVAKMPAGLRPVEPAARAARELFERKIATGDSERSDEDTLAGCEEMERRFGDSEDPAVQEWVAKARSNKGLALHRLNRHLEALAAWDDVVRHYGGSETPALQAVVGMTLFAKGITFKALQQPDDALAAFDEVLRRFETIETSALRINVGNALLAKVGILLERKRYEDSLAICNEVVRRFGASGTPALQAMVAKALVTKGVAFRALQPPKLDSALAAYTEALRRFGTRRTPASDEAMALALDGSAHVELQLQRFEAAIETAGRLIEWSGVEPLKHHRVPGHLIRARAFLAKGERSACEHDIESMLALLPEYSPLPRKVVDALVDFSVDLGPARMRELIAGSPSATLLLPLLTALEEELGLEPRVALEVAEVVRDIREELERRRTARKRETMNVGSQDQNADHRPKVAWWHRPFSVDELTASARSGADDQHEHRLSGSALMVAQNAALAMLTGWPTPQVAWWHRPFSVDELTASARSGADDQHEHRLSGSALMVAQNAALAMLTGWPTPLLRGEKNGRNSAVGSGLLVTDGVHYGVVTAGHVLDEAAKSTAAGEPIWAHVARPPGPRGTRTDNGRTPGIVLPISHQLFLVPANNYGRPDIGVAHLHADAVREACEEFHLTPLNVTEASKHLATDPLAGVHIAIGTPQDRQMTDGKGLPFIEAVAIKPCRTYRTGDMSYIGYGINGLRETGTKRNRNWRGFSGAPVWSLKPRPNVLDKLARDHANASFDDFEDARLVAMLCYQNTDSWGEGIDGPPDDFAHELYAHWIDARFLYVTKRLLSVENDSDKQVGRVEGEIWLERY